MKYILALLALAGLAFARYSEEGSSSSEEAFSEQANDIKDVFFKKFPAKEFGHFFTKLEQVMGQEFQQLTKRLEANEGNMDMTLAQFRDRLQRKYPQLKQAWKSLEAQLSNYNKILDEWTLKDVLKAAKQQLQMAFGASGYDLRQNGMKQWESVRAFFLTLHQQMKQIQVPDFD